MSQHQAGFAGVPVKRLKQTALTWKGAVHKVCHAILANFDPLPPVTLCHTSRDHQKYVTHIGLPLPRFLVGVVQKTLTKAPCTNSLSIVRGGFCQGVLSFVWKVLSVPPSLRMRVLQQKVKNPLKFHVSYI